MVTDSELEEGQRVYDAETPVFDVVSVLDSVASEVVAREEVTDRGHTIYSEMTVADLYPSYPEDDRVVKVMNVANGNESLWPISRVETRFENIIEQ